MSSIFNASVYDDLKTFNLSDDFAEIKVSEANSSSEEEIFRLQNVILKMEHKMEVLTKFIEENGTSLFSSNKGTNLTDEFVNLKTPLSALKNNSEVLLKNTAVFTNNLSILETGAPKCLDASQMTWLTFRTLWITYINLGGAKWLRDVMNEETRNYYSYILEIDMYSLTNLELFELIDKKQKLLLSPLEILKQYLVMPKSTQYSRVACEKYISVFTNCLTKYKSSLDSLAESVIVKLFFSKIQPSTMADQLSELGIKKIRIAILALEDKMRIKDQQILENQYDNPSKHKPNPNSTTTPSVSDGSTLLLTKKGLPLVCFNCKFSTAKNDNTNYSIWKCPKINYCYQCKLEHLAYCVDCLHHNLQIFDHERYCKTNVVPNTGVQSSNTSNIGNTSTQEKI